MDRLTDKSTDGAKQIRNGKCKYVCEISFGNGKIENIKTPDAKTQC